MKVSIKSHTFVLLIEKQFFNREISKNFDILTRY